MWIFVLGHRFYRLFRHHPPPPPPNQYRYNTNTSFLFFKACIVLHLDWSGGGGDDVVKDGKNGGQGQISMYNNKCHNQPRSPVLQSTVEPHYKEVGYNKTLL